MARKLRRNEIDLTQTRVYHVVSRCVRAIHLLGGKEQDDSRKELCMQCLQLLTEATAVEVAGFSLMNNHLHLLLRVDVQRAESWSDKEVAAGWLKLHPIRNGYFQPVEATDYQIGELVEKDEWVNTTRQKLYSISQFMKELKQRVAQAANRADRVTGAFWEGRYKVTPVHDEKQLLATMAYIDLNPFAANACKKPEEGRYTSLQGRLGQDKPRSVKEVRPAYESRGKKNASNVSAADPGNSANSISLPPRYHHRSQQREVEQSRQPASTWLLPMDEEYRRRRRCKTIPTKTEQQRQSVLPGLTMRIYLKLVDDVARLMRHGKKRLSKEARPILERLSLTSDAIIERIMNLRSQWQPYCA